MNSSSIISTVKLKNVLDYYDGPILITIVDSVDTVYVGQLINKTSEIDEFFCVPISQYKLELFYTGQIDLREIYLNPEIRFFSILKMGDYKKPMNLEFISEDKIPNEWYPDEGIKLAAYPTELDASIIKESRIKKASIIEAKLNPPEARGTEKKISAMHLMQFLHLFQSVVRYAFKSSIKNYSKESRKILDKPENYSLDVVSTAQGSFKIQFQMTSNLFGNSSIETALNIIDGLTLKPDDVENNLKIIKANKGHFVSSYTNLLRFIIDSDIPVSYSWIMPSQKNVTHRSISKSQAIPMYDELVRSEELSRTVIEIIGRVFDANDKKNTWGIEIKEDNKTLTLKGGLSEKAICTVSGITIGKTYKFTIEECLEMDVSTGKEKPLFYLINYKEIIQLQ